MICITYFDINRVRFLGDKSDKSNDMEKKENRWNAICQVASFLAMSASCVTKKAIKLFISTCLNTTRR